MVEKGIGSYQIGKARKSENEILKALQGGKWHRYQELVELTKLSQPTLSKHLKQLLKGIVERKVDTSGSEYPCPVFYRIKPRCDTYDKSAMPENPIMEEPSDIPYSDVLLSGKLHRIFQSVTVSISLQALLTFKEYFLEKNEDAYEQRMQGFVVPILEDTLKDLKQHLEILSKRGEDVPKLIDEAIQNLNRDYHELIQRYYGPLKPSNSRK